MKQSESICRISINRKVHLTIIVGNGISKKSTNSGGGGASLCANAHGKSMNLSALHQVMDN